MPIPTLENDQKAGNEEDQEWLGNLERLKVPDSLEGQGFDDEVAKEQAALQAATQTDDEPDTSKAEMLGRWGRLLRGARSKSATLSIIGILGGASFAGVVPAALGSLPMTLSKLTSNHSDMGNRLMDRSGLTTVFSMFGENRNCATATIKCKFNTISESRLKQWQARGVEVDATKNAFGRYKVRGLKFPDGTEVKSVKEWKNLRYTSKVAASLVKRLPIRANYELKKSAASQAAARVGKNFADKFRSDKSKDKAARKAANAAAMNERTGAVVDENGNVTRAGIEQKDKSKSVSAKMTERFRSGTKTLSIVGNASVPVVLACMGYDIIKATQAAMILMWNEELVKFAIPFFQAGSQQAESGVRGGMDAETLEYYGDRLTTPITQKDIDADDEDNITQDMLGKTAMDSKGIGAALNGDSAVNEDYTGWAPVKDVWGTPIVEAIQRTIGDDNIRTGCNVAAYTSILAVGSCLAGPAAITKCVGGAILIQAAYAIWADDLVNLVARQISEPAIKTIAEANLSDSLVGPPLGDALVSAAGIMGENMDLANLLPFAGTNEQAQTAYNDMVNDDDYTQTMIADIKEEAKKNQFDTSNQYSFAGQLLSKFSSVPMDGTLFSVFANMTNAVASVPVLATASAATKQGLYQPIEIYQSAAKFNGALGACRNPAKNENGIPCIGESGRAIPTFLPPASECMDKQLDDNVPDNQKPDCIEEAIDYLSSHTYKVTVNGKDEERPFLSKDESGAPSDFASYDKSKVDFDNPLLMYLRHCGNDRVFPLGYTDESAESDNYDWYIGKNCSSAITAKNFNATDLGWASFYLNVCIANWAREEDADNCWSTLAASTTTTSDGNWMIPVAGQCGDGFDPTATRIGRNHDGVDISAPAGTPLVAPTDVKVVAAGVSPDGSTGNMIAMEAVDGSGGFMFMHMQEPSPLKVGDTVKKGDPVGKVGSTGNSSGAHLHMDVFPPGTNPAGYSGQIDPVKAFAENGGAAITGCQ